MKAEIEDYFRLKEPLNDLYAKWKAADESFSNHLEQTGKKYLGLRLVNQDPHECLFSFLCSQNNNIGRITKMIDSLCETYGSQLCEVYGQIFYSFPTTEQLSKAKEIDLRNLGFGYRAKYVVIAAQQVVDKGGKDWLISLRNKDKKIVQQDLVSLMGVGKKVADCVSLFSCEKLDVLPVDTHVWQIACRYLPNLKNKKLNDQVYEEIGLFFKKKFGVSPHNCLSST